MSSTSSGPNAPRNARRTIAFAGRSNSANNRPERSRQWALAASRADVLTDADAVLIEVPARHKPAHQAHAPIEKRTIPTPIRIVRSNPHVLSRSTLVYSLGRTPFVRK